MLANKRRAAAGRNGVVAGSVWENRIKIDQVKGGIKVFNGGENPEEEDKESGLQVCRRLKSNRSEGVVRNRKTWKSEMEGNPIQLRKMGSDLMAKEADDLNKDPTLRGSFRNVGHIRAKIAVLSNEDEEEEDEEKEKEMDIDRESLEIKEVDSGEREKKSVTEEKQMNITEKEKIHEKQPNSPLKQKSVTEKEKTNQIQEIPITPFKQKSVADREKIHRIQETPISPSKQRSEQKIAEKSVADREKIHRIQETPISPSKQRSEQKIAEKEKIHQIQEKPISPFKQRSVAEKDKIHQIHEIPKSPYVEKQRILAEKQKLYPIYDIPMSENEEKVLPFSIVHPSVDPVLIKPPPTPVGETFESQGIQETQNRLQSIVDLVMWRDIPKSAFVFGLGTFALLSSSFAKDLNFSFISAISYLGLFYLAAIFFYKSILCRGATDSDDGGQKYMIGEEEAIWVLKFVLPYFNEVLVNMRSLFSGDPATTMKLAIFLFILARCGSSITMWTMTKLAFFGVFTLPKFCSAYSNQIAGYGKFWVRRFGDAWDSCTHKKAVAAAIFTVVWNLSSVIARIWAVFMLIVAVQLYQQQSSIKGEWCYEEEEKEEEEEEDLKGQRRQIVEGGLTPMQEKEKKAS